jgi:outer membrane protein OmpA-like peptidoglycan-associated protein
MRRLSSVAFLLPVLGLARAVYAEEAPAQQPKEEAPDPEQEVTSDAAMWRERDRALFEQDTLGGGSGLLHTQHAQSGAPGQIRVGLTTELFSAGFLCSQSAPCPNPNGGAPLTHDSLTHIGATLTLSATVTKWLEAYAATGAYGNADNADQPALLQVFGDSQLGLKAFFPVGRVLHLGGATELDLVNGSGAVGLVGAGTGAKFRAIGTVDLRGAEKPTPLRISLNTTYSVDAAAPVVAGYEANNGAPITRIERFGLEINRVDHIDIALGAEAFFVDERVRPFLEYTMLLPINRQGYACDPTNPNGDGCLATDTVIPSKLTLGGRFFPWKHGFSLTAGLDIGVTGVSSFIEELAPTAPWMLYLGAGWAIETKDHPSVERTKVVSRVLPPKFPGELHGKVHPKDKTDGIVDAILVIDDHPEITSRVSRADGTFNIPLDPGTYKLTVHAKGYRDGTCGGTLPDMPATVETDCPLEPALVAVTANEITISQQIQFQVDSAIILPESDGLMREIADTLIKNPRIKQVEVQGHTDSSGTDEYNQKLSEQRALSVRDWLTSHGVSPDRLVAHGYGETRPLIPNVTKGLKALNRRVQFIIIQQDAARP